MPLIISICISGLRGAVTLA